MTLADMFPPGFVPPPPSAMQLVAARRRALSEPFRNRGVFIRLSRMQCVHLEASHLVQFCGKSASVALHEAQETFPA